MQIIQDTNAGGRFGEMLGSALNQLAQHKLEHISKQYEQQAERSQFAKGLAPLLGQDTANFLSNLGPQERQYALQNIDALMQLNQQPGQQEQMGGMGALGGMQQQPQQQMQQPDQYQQLLQAARQQNGPMGALGIQPQQQQFSQVQPQQQVPGQQQAQQQTTPDRAKLIQSIFETPQAKRERQKLEFAEKQTNIKETKQYVNSLKEKEKAAKEANIRLKRMEVLIDKGNLPNAALWSSLSKLENAPFISGLTAPFAEILKGGVKWYSGNPSDIEEFEKLSNEFVKNAKQYFGNRITQREVEMYMQTVPNLMQTDVGKKKIIENIRSLNELTEIEAKAARSIIRENHGTAPVDIEQQVQDKIGNKLDKVAKKFTAK